MDPTRNCRDARYSPLERALKKDDPRDEDWGPGVADNSEAANLPPVPNLADGDIGRWVGKTPLPMRWTIEALVPEGMVTLMAGVLFLFGSPAPFSYRVQEPLLPREQRANGFLWSLIYH